MAQITYEDKVALYENEEIADINKCNASDMNEIKHTINGINDGTDTVDNLVVGSVSTKNMFGNYTIINGYITSPSFMRIRDTLTDRMAFVPCEANTTYTVSRSILTTTFRVGEYTSIPPMTDTNTDYTLPQSIIVNNSGTEITYTTGSTAKYLIIMYGNMSSDSNISESLASIQVEKGSTKTQFTPFQNLTPLQPYILMNTNTPISVNTEITLTDVYSNYKYIDIYSSMWSSNYINHTRLDTTWGTLEIPMVNSTTSGGTEQMVAVGQFSANKLTITRLSGFSVSSSQVISNITASPRIRKIVGYK